MTISSQRPQETDYGYAMRQMEHMREELAVLQSQIDNHDATLAQAKMSARHIRKQQTDRQDWIFSHIPIYVWHQIGINTNMGWESMQSQIDQKIAKSVLDWKARQQIEELQAIFGPPKTITITTGSTGSGNAL